MSNINNYPDNHIINILKNYFNVKKIKVIEQIKSGHINDTYHIRMKEKDYILQKINSEVFKSPYGMMHNVTEVSKYLTKKICYEGGNPSFHALQFIDNKYGQIITNDNEEYWRVSIFIPYSRTFEIIKNKEAFYEMGKVVGEFQKNLQNFPKNVLINTIPYFHDTQIRYNNLCNAYEHAKDIIKEEVKKEYNFFNNYKDLYRCITDKINDKQIPLRVTHNDTKPSNILFSTKTKKALCLIDLDTVMMGSIVYDYGDALRIGASSAKEDDECYDNISINLNYIASFTKGFLSKVKGMITPCEVSLLSTGYLLMAMEVGMRFLTDYIENDKYFKVSKEKHNLIRARNQIKVSEEIIKNKEEIDKIINSLLKKLHYKENYNF